MTLDVPGETKWEETTTTAEQDSEHEPSYVLQEAAEPSAPALIEEMTGKQKRLEQARLERLFESGDFSALQQVYQSYSALHAIFFSYIEPGPSCIST